LTPLSSDGQLLCPSGIHVNLNGEYDFSDEKMVDSVGLEMTPKILDLKLV